MLNLLCYGHICSFVLTGLVEIWLTDSEGPVVADVNVSSAGECVDISQSIADFTDTDVTVSAIIDVTRGNVFASSVDG
jgi:hypothetical protein